MIEFASYLVAYLLGTIQTGLLVAAATGVPLRDLGSGNTGAANVVRTIGWKGGLLTVVGDGGKGFVAASIGTLLVDDPAAPVIAGLAAVVGHCFPIWWRFRGGKGVATAMGVSLSIFPWVGGIAVATYAAVLLATRISSAGSMSAMTVLTTGSLLLVDGRPTITFAMLAIFTLVIVRHGGNLRRLARRREHRLVIR
jgi:glycerol-3-phosphate acyltransferase PlsY